MTNEERDELLIRVDERTIHLDKQMDNHLRHHFRYTILAWSITLTALASLIISLLIK